MDVDGAAPRHVEHRLRQDEPIRGDHHHIGAGGLQRGPFGRILQRARLAHRQTERVRQGFHR
jgi:hypothetical protein